MVTLSGGNLGGSQVDGTGWIVGDEQVFDGHRYRRIDDTTAVFVGSVS